MFLLNYQMLQKIFQKTMKIEIFDRFEAPKPIFF